MLGWASIEEEEFETGRGHEGVAPRCATLRHTLHQLQRFKGKDRRRTDDDGVCAPLQFSLPKSSNPRYCQLSTSVRGIGTTDIRLSLLNV
ncbi:hypothetical protein M0804_000232 [Polistes exclamans]|nr:hypothetical protein M0804_000232 [Polistes exclamans]